MIGQRPGRLNFSPALACVDCQWATNQGLMYHMGSLAWQLLPLCDEHIEEPSDSDEPISLRALRCCIHEQLAVRLAQERMRDAMRAAERMGAIRSTRVRRSARLGLASVLVRAIPTVTGTRSRSQIRSRIVSAASWSVTPCLGTAAKKNSSIE